MSKPLDWDYPIKKFLMISLIGISLALLFGLEAKRRERVREAAIQECMAAGNTRRWCEILVDASQRLY
jgi:hypothetical protein